MKSVEELKKLVFTDYPDLVSVEQLQTMLNINRHAAYDLIASGAVLSTKIGRKYVIPKISVIEFLFGKPLNQTA